VNFHQLEIFYAVVQRKSITAAASDLHLTQPAVSLQIRALEKNLGLPLLERGGQKLRVTQAGEALYRCAVSILHAKDEAERAIAELGAATKGKLILGANTTGGMYVLPRIVRAFKELHPQTEVIFQIESTEWLYEKILQNVVDMGLVGGPTEDRRFGVEPICLDHLVLVVSPSHPFARFGKVPLKELKTQPCILPLQGSRTRQLVERKLKEAGVTLRVTMQLPGTEAVKKAVEANLGFGFVSGYAVERECSLGDLKIITVDRLDLSRHMELIYRRQKYFSPVAERFRQFARSYGLQQLDQVVARSDRWETVGEAGPGASAIELHPPASAKKVGKGGRKVPR
jgi:DNA-binding transcriptional LysR family regulator